MSSGVISVKNCWRIEGVFRAITSERNYSYSGLSCLFSDCLKYVIFKSTFLAFLICPVLQDNLYFLQTGLTLVHWVRCWQWWNSSFIMARYLLNRVIRVHGVRIKMTHVIFRHAFECKNRHGWSASRLACINACLKTAWRHDDKNSL